MDLFAYWLGATAHHLIDPLSILLGIVVGMLARRWFHVFGLAILAGVAFRLIVFAVNSQAREEPFMTMQLAAAAGAAGLIGAVIYALRSHRNRRMT